MDLDQQAVLRAALERAEALASSDEEALRQLHAPSLRWTTHTGEVLDRERYIAGNVSGLLIWRSQNLEDVQIEVYGDCGVLTGVVVDDVERDGQGSTFRLRLTQVWARDRDGTWRCVAGHAGPKLG